MQRPGTTQPASAHHGALAGTRSPLPPPPLMPVPPSAPASARTGGGGSGVFIGGFSRRPLSARSSTYSARDPSQRGGVARAITSATQAQSAAARPLSSSQQHRALRLARELQSQEPAAQQEEEAEWERDRPTASNAAVTAASASAAALRAWDPRTPPLPLAHPSPRPLRAAGGKHAAAMGLASARRIVQQRMEQRRAVKGAQWDQQRAPIEEEKQQSPTPSAASSLFDSIQPSPLQSALASAAASNAVSRPHSASSVTSGTRIVAALEAEHSPRLAPNDSSSPTSATSCSRNHTPSPRLRAASPRPRSAGASLMRAERPASSPATSAASLSLTPRNELTQSSAPGSGRRSPVVIGDAETPIVSLPEAPMLPLSLSALSATSARPSFIRPLSVLGNIAEDERASSPALAVSESDGNKAHRRTRSHGMMMPHSARPHSASAVVRFSSRAVSSPAAEAGAASIANEEPSTPRLVLRPRSASAASPSTTTPRAVSHSASPVARDSASAKQPSTPASSAGSVGDAKHSSASSPASSTPRASDNRNTAGAGSQETLQQATRPIHARRTSIDAVRAMLTSRLRGSRPRSSSAHRPGVDPPASASPFDSMASTPHSASRVSTAHNSRASSPQGSRRGSVDGIPSRRLALQISLLVANSRRPSIVDPGTAPPASSSTNADGSRTPDATPSFSSLPSRPQHLRSRSLAIDMRMRHPPSSRARGAGEHVGQSADTSPNVASGSGGAHRRKVSLGFGDASSSGMLGISAAAAQPHPPTLTPPVPISPACSLAPSPPAFSVFRRISPSPPAEEEEVKEEDEEESGSSNSSDSDSTESIIPSSDPVPLSFMPALRLDVSLEESLRQPIIDQRPIPASTAAAAAPAGEQTNSPVKTGLQRLRQASFDVAQAGAIARMLHRSVASIGDATMEESKEQPPPPPARADEPVIQSPPDNTPAAQPPAQPEAETSSQVQLLSDCVLVPASADLPALTLPLLPPSSLAAFERKWGNTAPWMLSTREQARREVEHAERRIYQLERTKPQVDWEHPMPPSAAPRLDAPADLYLSKRESLRRALHEQEELQLRLERGPSIEEQLAASTVLVSQSEEALLAPLATPHQRKGTDMPEELCQVELDDMVARQIEQLRIEGRLLREHDDAAAQDDEDSEERSARRGRSRSRRSRRRVQSSGSRDRERASSVSGSESASTCDTPRSTASSGTQAQTQAQQLVHHRSESIAAEQKAQAQMALDLLLAVDDDSDDDEGMQRARSAEQEEEEAELAAANRDLDSWYQDPALLPPPAAATQSASRPPNSRPKSAAKKAVTFLTEEPQTADDGEAATNAQAQTATTDRAQDSGVLVPVDAASAGLNSSSSCSPRRTRSPRKRPSSASAAANDSFLRLVTRALSECHTPHPRFVDPPAHLNGRAEHVHELLQRVERCVSYFDSASEHECSHGAEVDPLTALQRSSFDEFDPERHMLLDGMLMERPFHFSQPTEAEALITAQRNKLAMIERSFATTVTSRAIERSSRVKMHGHETQQSSPLRPASARLVKGGSRPHSARLLQSRPSSALRAPGSFRTPLHALLFYTSRRSRASLTHMLERTDPLELRSKTMEEARAKEAEEAANASVLFRAGKIDALQLARLEAEREQTKKQRQPARPATATARLVSSASGGRAGRMNVRVASEASQPSSIAGSIASSPRARPHSAVYGSASSTPPHSARPASAQIRPSSRWASEPHSNAPPLNAFIVAEGGPKAEDRLTPFSKGGRYNGSRSRSRSTSPRKRPASARASSPHADSPSAQRSFISLDALHNADTSAVVSSILASRPISALADAPLPVALLRPREQHLVLRRGSNSKSERTAERAEQLQESVRAQAADDAGSNASRGRHQAQSRATESPVPQSPTRRSLSARSAIVSSLARRASSEREAERALVQAARARASQLRFDLPLDLHLPPAPTPPPLPDAQSQDVPAAMDPEQPSSLAALESTASLEASIVSSPVVTRPISARPSSARPGSVRPTSAQRVVSDVKLPHQEQEISPSRSASPQLQSQSHSQQMKPSLPPKPFALTPTPQSESELTAEPQAPARDAPSEFAALLQRVNSDRVVQATTAANSSFSPAPVAASEPAPPQQSRPVESVSKDLFVVRHSSDPHEQQQLDESFVSWLESLGVWQSAIRALSVSGANEASHLPRDFDRRLIALLAAGDHMERELRDRDSTSAEECMMELTEGLRCLRLIAARRLDALYVE